jgi:putative endonuclease
MVPSVAPAVWSEGGLVFAGRATDGKPSRTGQQGIGMRYVYLLKNSTGRHYIGSTEDLNARLALHNAGKIPSTAQHRPWTVHLAIRFADDRRANAFEQYLKSGSGHAFANRHLW